MTIFRKPIKDKEKIIEILEKYRDFNFGTFNFEHYYLLFDDWYQRKKSVNKLFKFWLKLENVRLALHLS